MAGDRTTIGLDIERPTDGDVDGLAECVRCGAA
jgi:hypothetical protein